MKVNVKALSGFMHGRANVAPGDTLAFNKMEAEDLQKAGLVEITGDAPADAGEDDLLGDGGAKMDAAPENKMASAPTVKKGK